MADAMIGFGIGLSGVPKDYTGIVAARERQKQLGELEKEKKKQAALEPIMKNIALTRDDLYMPWRTAEIEKKTAEYVDAVTQATTSGDIRTQAILTQEYNRFLSERAAERKAYDEVTTQWNKGNYIFNKPPTDLQRFKTVEEALQYAKDNPEDLIVSSTGIIGYSPVEKVNLQDIYINNQKNSNGNYKIINGQSIWVADINDFTRRNSSTYDASVAVRRSARANYISQFGEDVLNKLSPEEQNNEVKRFFLETGKPFIPGQKMKFEPKANVTNVNLGGDQGANFGDWTPQPLEFLFTNLSGQSTQGKYEDSYGVSLQKFDVSMPATTGYRNLNSGAKIPFTVGDDIKFSGAYILPVVKKGRVTTKGQKEGEIILPYDLEEQAKKGNVEYQLIATGQGKIMPAADGAAMYDEKGQVLSEQVKVYRPFNEAMGAFEQGLSEAEKKDWKNNKYPAAMKLVREKNEELRRLYGGGKPAPKAGGTAPATGGPSKWFSGEYNAKGVK